MLSGIWPAQNEHQVLLLLWALCFDIFFVSLVFVFIFCLVFFFLLLFLRENKNWSCMGREVGRTLEELGAEKKSSKYSVWEKIRGGGWNYKQMGGRDFILWVNLAFEPSDHLQGPGTQSHPDWDWRAVISRIPLCVLAWAVLPWKQWMDFCFLFTVRIKGEDAGADLSTCRSADRLLLVCISAPRASPLY